MDHAAPGLAAAVFALSAPALFADEQAPNAAPRPTPAFLQTVFKQALDPNVVQALGADPSPEKLVSAMMPDQRESAKAKLKALEPTAKPDDLSVIERGYRLLGDGAAADALAAKRRQQATSELSKAASDAYAQGNRAEAKRLAAEALKRDPNDKTANAILKLADPKVGAPKLKLSDPFAANRPEGGASDGGVEARAVRTKTAGAYSRSREETAVVPAAPSETPRDKPTQRGVPPAVPIGAGGLMLLAAGYAWRNGIRDEAKAWWKDVKYTTGIGMAALGAYGLATGIVEAASAVTTLPPLVAAWVGGSGGTTGAVVAVNGAALAEGVIATAQGAVAAKAGVSFAASQHEVPNEDSSARTENPRRTNPSKSESPVWKRLQNFKNGLKRTGFGSKTQYYKWDSLHNDIEVFDSRGSHLGSMDPNTGQMYKPSKGYSIRSEL